MEDLLAKIETAIKDVHKAFGAPGDYGYDTPQGDALFALYKLRLELAKASETIANDA